MPYRGRDTVYVESLIALCNIACGLICILVNPPIYETTTLTLMRSLAPVGFWCFLWLGAGIMLMHGWRSRKLKWIEYGAVWSAALWIMVSFNAMIQARSYPLTAALAPIFAAYSALIYFYQARINTSGRVPEPRQ